jgi:hypothetical protein
MDNQEQMEGINAQEVRKIVLEVVRAMKDLSGGNQGQSVRSVDNTELDRLTWMDAREAGRYLRRTANAIRIMASRGILTPRKLGRRLYFRRTDLDRVLEASIY